MGCAVILYRGQQCRFRESVMKPELPPLQLSQQAPGKAPPPLEKQPFLPEESPVVEKQSPRNRKILVVDDNPVVLKAFELKLHASGFDVICASDGGAVVSTARRENPDLIILDINFPGSGGSGDPQWSGLTIMQWLERFQEGSEIPIIIVTGEDPAKQKEKYLAAGAVGFFQKPVNYPELLAAILQAIGESSG
jgi:CheY-like chemotaxis protein